MTPAQHRQAREIVNGYEDRHKHLRGYYSRTDLLTVAKLALAQIIADCEASSDPLAVAARLERAEAENARLREALRGLVSVIRPLVEIDDNVCYLNGRYAAQVDTFLELAEAALGKDGV